MSKEVKRAEKFSAKVSLGGNLEEMRNGAADFLPPDRADLRRNKRNKRNKLGKTEGF